MDSVINTTSDIAIRAAVDAASNKGLIADKCLLNWRVKGALSWQSVQLTRINSLDSMAADIPRQPSNTSIEYYLQAADSSGRTATLPRSAPNWVFSFRVLQGVSVAGKRYAGKSTMTMQLEIGQTHRSPAVFILPRNTRVSLFITDLTGRTIATLIDDTNPEERIIWDGSTDSGRSLPGGLYLAIMKTNVSVQVANILLSK
jgi:hypothetical protein